jgi:hypothetical protein
VTRLRGANLALRFLLELAVLAIVVWWGAATVDGALGWLVGLGAAAALAAVWGVLVSPKAAIAAPAPVRLGVELVVWVAGGAALWSLGRPALAAAPSRSRAACSTPCPAETPPRL